MALKKSDLEGIREIVEIAKILGEIEKTTTVKIEPSYHLSKVIEAIQDIFKGLLTPEFITALAEEKKEEAAKAEGEAKEAAKLW